MRFARTDSITLSDAAAAKVFQLAILARAAAATRSHHRLYLMPHVPYTAIENMFRLGGKLPTLLQSAVTIFLLFSFCLHSAQAQNPAQKPAEKTLEKKPEKTTPPKQPENPAQIELLETRYRFEANGDSRKEVHARVKINSEIGVRQFARLDFDYNRSFESIEMPLVRITHISGGTADILPRAITDNPNPAVVNAPAYQDVRVKSVRILGLEPGDILEYCVVTTTSHHPLAPDFFLTHDFSRGGVVTQEIFEVDLPATRAVQLRTSLEGRGYQTERQGEGDGARVIHKWMRPPLTPGASRPEGTAARTEDITDLPVYSQTDVALTTFPSWVETLLPLQKSFRIAAPPSPETKARAEELTHDAKNEEDEFRALYDFVSQKMITVDLPVGATGFRIRDPREILSSSYATPEDKCGLLSALAWQIGLQAAPALMVSGANSQRDLAIPSTFTNALVLARFASKTVWLDPSIEVAPFGMIGANLRGKPALLLQPASDVQFFQDVSVSLPFAASQHVYVGASLAANGELSAKVHYALRGDNELLLRVAFHQSPKEKWKELAQLLSISDGFRGQVSSVNTSDPYATREPFTLDYEITMPKFVDWSKKPVRIPALLPQLGLPDPPAKPVAGSATSPIDLGTPLEVETQMTLRLPPGTSAQTPTGTSVQRDYATYASQYSAKDSTISASRHINFLLREIPANRAVDYNAFLRAVQSDEAQDFTLVREDSPAPEKKKVAPKSPASTQVAGAEPKP